MSAVPTPDKYSDSGRKWYKLDLSGFDDRAGDLRKSAVSPIIADACARWSAVSPFDFEDVDGTAPNAAAHASDPDIVFKFGAVVASGSSLLEVWATTTAIGQTKPRTVTFYDKANWSSFNSAHRDPEWRGTGLWDMAVKQMSLWFSSNVDFETVAVHEIGHVLGLGHSTDDSSIMQETVNDAQFRYFLAEKGLPTVDVVGLDALYGIEGKFETPTGALGYAIVGGRLMVGDLNGNGFKDDPDYLWGEEVAEDLNANEVLLATGWCMNRFLGAPGYCHIIVNLVPDVRQDSMASTVVGGCAFIPYDSNRPNGTGTILAGSKWGASTSEIQPVARWSAYDQSGSIDPNVYYRWYLAPWGSATALFMGGQERTYFLDTYAGPTLEKAISEKLLWGAQPGGTADYDPPGAVTLAAGLRQVAGSPPVNFYSACMGFLAAKKP